MRLSGRSYLIVLFILLFLKSLTPLEGHGGVYIPPPPPKPKPVVPDSNPSSPGTPGGLPGPATPGPRTPSNPSLPPGANTSGGKSGAGGGLTRKNKAVTSVDVSWQNWWARNRFQFLDIPTEINTSAYPTTPKATDDANVKGYIKSQTCALIRPYLASPVARLKRASIIGLARLNDTQSLPGITCALTCGNQTVRDNALMALGLIDSPVARHPLLHIAGGNKSAATRFLKQSSVPDYFQAFALISLTLGKTKGIVPILKSVVINEESSPQVKAMALECMGHIGGPDEIRFLMDLLEDNKKLTNELIASAVTAIAKSDDPACLPFLKKCLSSRSKPMVQSAVLGVGRLARSDDIKLVKRLFSLYKASSDKAIKGFSLISLGLIGGPLAIKHLDYVIMNGRSSECGWACLGMGLAMRKTNQKNVVNRLLVKAKNHANRSVRGAAVIGLGLIGEKRTVPALTKILQKGDDPLIRCYAATALGIINDKDSLPHLRKALKEDASPNVVCKTAIALAIMKDTESIDYMVERLLSSNNDMVQTFITLGLSFMGDMKAYDLISEAIQEKKLEEITKLHCIHLLSKLVSGMKVPYLDPIAVGSNFACEYPLVSTLLQSGI